MRTRLGAGPAGSLPCPRPHIPGCHVGRAEAPGEVGAPQTATASWQLPRVTGCTGTSGPREWSSLRSKQVSELAGTSQSPTVVCTAPIPRKGMVRPGSPFSGSSGGLSRPGDGVKWGRLWRWRHPARPVGTEKVSSWTSAFSSSSFGLSGSGARVRQLGLPT